jgi:hypothetical protein
LLICIHDPPYDFSLSAAIFAGGDPQIRTYEDDLFRQALDIGGNPVLVEVFFGRIGRQAEIASLSPLEYFFFKERDKRYT